MSGDANGGKEDEVHATIEELLSGEISTVVVQLNGQDERHTGSRHLLPDLCKSLAESKVLHTLTFQHWKWSDAEQAAVSRLLTTASSSVRNVTLEDVGLTALTARSFGQALPWKHLERLSLADNPKLGPRGCRTLLQEATQVLQIAQEQSLGALIGLDLSHVRLSHLGAQVLGPLVAGLSSTLRELNVANNELGADGIWKLVAGGPTALHHLRELNVSQNQTGDDGCTQLLCHLASSSASSSSSSLQVLHMARNDIRVSGATCLAQKLPLLPHLQEVGLEHNALDNVAAQQLAAALQSCSSLTILRLSHNAIGDDGCVALAQGLLGSSSSSQDDAVVDNLEAELQSMIQRVNSEDRDADLLMDMMGLEEEEDKEEQTTGCRLQQLHLDSNQIGDEGAGAFVEHLDALPHLQVLHLQGNKAISAARQRILDLLLRHRQTPVRTSGTFLLPDSPVVSPPLSPVASPRRGGGAGPTDDDDDSYENSDQENDVSFNGGGAGAGGMEDDGLAMGRTLLQAALKDDEDESHDALDILELPMEYTCHLTNQWETVLAWGAFGSLHLARNDDDDDSDNTAISTTSQLYVKRVFLSSTKGNRMAVLRRAVLGELKNHIRHQCLAPLVAFSKRDDDTQQLYAFIYRGGGTSSACRTLRQCLLDPDTRRQLLSWPVRLRIGAAIAQALDFLHTPPAPSPGQKRKPCFHGDVQPSNVLVSLGADADAVRVQLLDAGISRLVATDRDRFARGGDVVFGSRAYRCPRYERGSVAYDARSDVFSLGILLAELVTAQLQRTATTVQGEEISRDVYYDNLLARQPLHADPLTPLAPKMDRGTMQTIGEVVPWGCLNNDGPVLASPWFSPQQARKSAQMTNQSLATVAILFVPLSQPAVTSHWLFCISRALVTCRVEIRSCRVPNCLHSRPWSWVGRVVLQERHAAI